MNIIDDKNKAGNLLLLIFSLFYLVNIDSIAEDPTQMDAFFTAKTLPWILATLSTCISLFKLVLPTDNKQSIKAYVVNFQWKTTLSLLALMFAYSLLFNWLGFFLSTMLFLFIGFFNIGRKSLRFGCLRRFSNYCFYVGNIEFWF